MLKRLFCLHSYNLINNFTIDSEFDIVHKSGCRPKTTCSLTRTYITDYKCSKCGKIKRLTAKTAKI